MAKNQGPRRSDEEWFRLINECRRSGLSDSLWCKQQVIPATHLDNSHTVEIEVHGINIRIFNGVDTGLLKTVLSSLGGAGC